MSERQKNAILGKCVPLAVRNWAFWTAGSGASIIGAAPKSLRSSTLTSSPDQVLHGVRGWGRDEIILNTLWIIKRRNLLPSSVICNALAWNWKETYAFKLIYIIESEKKKLISKPVKNISTIRFTKFNLKLITLQFIKPTRSCNKLMKWNRNYSFGRRFTFPSEKSGINPSIVFTQEYKSMRPQVVVVKDFTSMTMVIIFLIFPIFPL